MNSPQMGIGTTWIKPVLVLGLLLLLGQGSFGQTEKVQATLSPPQDSTMVDPNVQQATWSSSSCASCGYAAPGPKGCCGVCPSSSCGDCCTPGRTHCCSICDESAGPWKQICCGLYHGICCPDPCYEPRWLPEANAAFWVDDARPVSHLRLRYDGLFNVRTPDRAEFYVGNDGDTLREKAHINEFHIYSETAIGQKFAFFIDLPFRSYEQFQSDGTTDSSGFGDMSLGTKSVLLDSEIWVVTFQFKTYIPTGAVSQRLGTGHVTLEPAILTYTKMSPDFYIQFQSGLWIPISGTSSHAGNVLHNRLSLNYVLYRILPDVPLIGTLEFVNYNVLSGGFDDEGVIGSGSGAYFGIGPGIRLDVCKNIDIGVAGLFSVTNNFYESEAVRAEFRWRF